MRAAQDQKSHESLMAMTRTRRNFRPHSEHHDEKTRDFTGVHSSNHKTCLKVIERLA